MKRNPFKFAALFAVMTIPLMAGQCESDANVATQNLKTAADNFEVNRRIVFVNGITDKYLLSIEGYCSMDLNSGGTAFNVICKTGRNEYKRHTLVLSDNVSAVVEQLDSIKASAYHYRVVFKPQTIIPDIDFRGSLNDLTTNSSELNQ